MHHDSITRSGALAAVSLIMNASAAQVTPIGSSLETRSEISLSVVDLDDESMQFDDQGATTDQLGPHETTVLISSDDGVFTGASDADAAFASASAGTFTASQSYDGNRAAGDVTAPSFQTTMSGRFEYDFVIPSQGSVRFQGGLTNSGPSFIGFTARINVLAESVPGGGFTGSFFEELITDPTSAGPTAFDITVPLAAASGSYRIQIRLTHSGSSALETDPESGSLTVDWSIDTPTTCPPDLAPPGAPDGVLNFFDLSQYIALFTASDPQADLFPAGNPDGVFNFFDVSAYIAAYTAGCP